MERSIYCYSTSYSDFSFWLISVNRLKLFIAEKKLFAIRNKQIEKYFSSAFNLNKILPDYIARMSMFGIVCSRRVIQNSKRASAIKLYVYDYLPRFNCPLIDLIDRMQFHCFGSYVTQLAIKNARTKTSNGMWTWDGKNAIEKCRKRRRRKIGKWQTK